MLLGKISAQAFAPIISESPTNSGLGRLFRTPTTFQIQQPWSGNAGIQQVRLLGSGRFQSNTATDELCQHTDWALVV